MPARDLYLIRRLEDGTMRTVEAASTRAAMRLFAIRYAPPAGEVFGVKQRNGGDWELYSVTQRGLRRLQGGLY